MEKLSIFSGMLDAEIITPIDFEFCRFLLEIRSDIDVGVLYAACITSIAYQNGNVCITLADHAGQKIFEGSNPSEETKIPSLDKWRSILKQSTVVGAPGDFKPLILDNADRLYLHKLWSYEQNLILQITEKINERAAEVDTDLLENGVSRLFNDSEAINWQKVAAIAAVHNLFTVISGGPGTGKTTTVIRLLALLMEQGQARNSMPSIALAAPTGKAAARLEMSIRDTIDSLPVEEDIKEAIPTKAVTLHQLLGARRHSARFRFNEDNPLPFDGVIMDEVSMVDQALMSHLMDALLPGSRLLLLGDKDQLASVEAGSILGDLCGENHTNKFSKERSGLLKQYNVNLSQDNITAQNALLTDHIILLQKSYRFGLESGIGQLATAVHSGRDRGAIQLLKGSEYSDISIVTFDEYKKFEDALFERVRNQFKKIQSSVEPSDMLDTYRTQKILSAHRKGPWGVELINNRMEQRLQAEGLISPYDRWYQGRPIIINTNDYSVGLSNGDLGVCIMANGETLICFEEDVDVIKVSPTRLPSHSTAYALTVHKSQGSEFDDVCLVLPDRCSKIMSRELLYTAISRARKLVEIMGTPEVLSKAIKQKIARHSGLQDYFWE